MSTDDQHIHPSARRPVRPHSGGPGAARRLVGRLRDRLAEQRRAEALRRREVDLRQLWREACIGVGLCQWVPVPAGFTARTPRFGGLRSGPEGTSFTVELLPGGEPEDISTHAARLARSLGAAGLQVQPLGGRWIRVRLHGRDPVSASDRRADGERTGRAEDPIPARPAPAWDRTTPPAITQR